MLVDSAVDDPSVDGRVLEEELLGARAGLGEMLGRIHRSRSLADEIAGRSYWHPNGFVKLVLEQHARRGQLRLHVWPALPAAEDIHGHAWCYGSVVIGGALKDVPYAETDRDMATPMWRHTYGQTGHRRFALADPVPVRVAETGQTRVLRTGDRSGGGPDHVHRFFAIEAPAATMLRVGPVVRRHSHVYRDDAVPPQVVEPRPTTRADVAEWLAVVGEMVAAAGG